MDSPYSQVENEEYSSEKILGCFIIG